MCWYPDQGEADKLLVCIQTHWRDADEQSFPRCKAEASVLSWNTQTCSSSPWSKKMENTIFCFLSWRSVKGDAGPVFTMKPSFSMKKVMNSSSKKRIQYLFSSQHQKVPPCPDEARTARSNSPRTRWQKKQKGGDVLSDHAPIVTNYFMANVSSVVRNQ